MCKDDIGLKFSTVVRNNISVFYAVNALLIAYSMNIVFICDARLRLKPCAGLKIAYLIWCCQ